MNFDTHLNNICNKANQKLGFLKRNLSKCPPNVKEIAYKTIVRPNLEYASQAWDPHFQNKIKKIEHIQRQAARWVTSEYRREPGIVTQILNDLEWQTLESRRKNARLVLFFKSLNGMTAIDLPECVIESVARPTRKICKLSCNTDVYKFGFVNRAIGDWNSLPSHIINTTSLDQFKIDIAKLN